jgi:hypothetical protein
MTDAAKSGPERIWLEPECCADPSVGRTWCKDNVWPLCDCDAQAEATEYVRADLVAAIRALPLPAPNLAGPGGTTSTDQPDPIQAVNTLGRITEALGVPWDATASRILEVISAKQAEERQRAFKEAANIAAAVRIEYERRHQREWGYAGSSDARVRLRYAVIACEEIEGTICVVGKGNSGAGD